MKFSTKIRDQRVLFALGRTSKLSQVSKTGRVWMMDLEICGESENFGVAGYQNWRTYDFWMKSIKE